MKRLVPSALPAALAISIALTLASHGCNGEIEPVDVVTLDADLSQDAGGDAGPVGAQDASLPLDAGATSGG
jgi:hypothetical protein